MPKQPGARKSAKDWQQDLPRSFPAGSQRPCVVCNCTDATVRFLRFRKVTGAVVLARANDEWGFLCRKCATRMYVSAQGHNLLLGWWGLAGLIYHNPAAIIGNTVMIVRGTGRLHKADADYIQEYIKKTRPR
jgi:hypothetical protein